MRPQHHPALAGRTLAVTASLLLAALALSLGLAGCGGGGSGSNSSEPVVIATTPILGALVSELVGEHARVRVLVPNGADPHDFAPSAQDVAALTDADAVVANGLLEEGGLRGGLEEARRAGVPVLSATDHVRLQPAGPEGDHGQGEHGQDPHDPHIWMDPVAMAGVVEGIAPALAEAIGADLGTRPAELGQRLRALSDEVERRLAGIPPEQRTLVTGHDSMGYFATRYGFEVVGAIIPSLSTHAEVSAGDLAELRERIETTGVPAIFTELGTPPDVAEALAREAGVRVVALPSHTLPEDGSYVTFMRQVAGTIERGLGAGAPAAG